jgi:hypothetical protein
MLNGGSRDLTAYLDRRDAAHYLVVIIGYQDVNTAQG